MMATHREAVPDIMVRQLSYGDLPAIMEIERKAFTTPWRASTFEGLIARHDSDLLGALRNGFLLGYCVTWTIGDQAELGNVAVAEVERGRGTGRMLVEAALERVGARGARECFLEVRESNHVARTLYESCGFVTIGRRKNYYVKPLEDALVMRRELI